MERVPKQKSEAEHTLRPAQARFTSKSQNENYANAFADSPMMAIQRRTLHGLFGDAIQRKDEDEDKPRQLRPAPESSSVAEASTKPNRTGLPDSLKNGIETLSGLSMDNVQVHYNSPQPAQLNALAYAQGTDIHVAPGQERHLPHEAWHVVQQAQGRVQPTMQMKDGVPINDDRGLEHEADVMGTKALNSGSFDTETVQRLSEHGVTKNSGRVFPGTFAVQLESASYGETQVEWKTGTLGGDTVGEKMEATKLKKSSVGKHSNLIGSPPGSGEQSTLMSYLPTNPKLTTANKYIKGHLLNHNIGGPGKRFNMFPITASANKTHLTAVETTVKNWVNTGRTVNYTVEVTNIDSTKLGAKGGKSGEVSASFDCRASNDKGESINQTIPSQLGQKSVAQEGSVFQGLGNTGIFAKAYDWAADVDDPSDMLWEVAEKLAGKTGVQKNLMADVLIGIVLFDDTEDISADAREAITENILVYLKSDKDWAKELGIKV